MPETINVEAAHNLGSKHESLEILEAIVLAAVAIATAWSGYQAARWEGEEQESYVHSTELRVEASRELAEGAEVFALTAVMMMGAVATVISLPRL